MFTPDARRYPRFLPTSPIPADFLLQNQRVRGAELVNLSLGGIGGWLDERYAHFFELNLRLREVSIHHPGFPEPVPDLKVVFSTLRGQSARPGYMMFGAEFLKPPEAFLDALSVFLETLPAE